MLDLLGCNFLGLTMLQSSGLKAVTSFQGIETVKYCAFNISWAWANNIFNVLHYSALHIRLHCASDIHDSPLALHCRMPRIILQPYTGKLLQKSEKDPLDDAADSTRCNLAENFFYLVVHLAWRRLALLDVTALLISLSEKGTCASDNLLRNTEMICHWAPSGRSRAARRSSDPKISRF